MHSEWQPIETAPMDGTGILGYWKSPMITGNWRFEVAEYREDNWVDPETGDAFFTDPTHWMPLPRPPK